MASNPELNPQPRDKTTGQFGPRPATGKEQSSADHAASIPGGPSKTHFVADQRAASKRA